MSLPAAYLSVIIIWSTTPLAISWSTLDTGFSFGVLLRMLIGLMLCAVIALLWRIRFPLHKRAIYTYLISGISMFSSISLVYWSAQHVNSGLISVLFGLSPLITSLGAALWLQEKLLSPSKLSGITLGFSGLVMVFYGNLQLSSSAALGIATLLLAATLQCAGLIALKRIADDSPPLATTLGSLIVAFPLFTLLWWLLDGAMPTHISTQSLVAIGYLGIFGSVLGFAMYYHLIKHMEAGKISLITLITPVFALLLGQSLNHEQISTQVWLGSLTILAGLACHQWGNLTRRKIPT